MKHLKRISFLLIMVAFITSCEKETIILDSSVEENQRKSIPEINSVTELLESGIDVNTYFNSLPKQDSKLSKSVLSQRIVELGVQFFTNEEVFCNNLPIEDFEEGRGNSIGFTAPLNDTSNNSVFQPGEIVSGVNITTSNSGNSTALAFFAANGAGNNESKIVGSNQFVEFLIIEFATNDVTSVSMNVIAWQDGNPATTIEVYGFSGLIGQTNVNASSVGAFLAIESNEPISRITLNSNGGAEFIDDLAFGICTDVDGDGVLNEDDLYPNSNISEELSFDGCEPGVTNVFGSNGITMADEVDAIIAAIWEKLNTGNHPRNYNPQRQFQRDMINLLNKWYRNDRVVTDREKFEITKCVRSSRIFNRET